MHTPPPLSYSAICAMMGSPVPEGAPHIMVAGITTLEEASEHHASFVARAKFAPKAAESRAGVILVPPHSKLDRPGVVEVKDIWGGVLTLLEYFHPVPTSTGRIHPTAVIAESAQLAGGVEVGPYAVIGERVRIETGAIIGAHCCIGDDCAIGEGTRLYPRVTLYHGVAVGKRVIIHSGAVIGSDGFKYEAARMKLCKIPQVGNVVIDDEVEIGANTAIDRASFTTTRIGAGTKIDNLVQVGHNVQLGRGCLVVAQVGIGGSAKIGNGVILAGQVGVKDNVTIGDGVRVGAQSGITDDLPARTDWLGSPAIPAKDRARVIAIEKRLPEVWKKLGPMLDEPGGKG
jgi:UDP-3-O-[3-hydroxymyristoyl] glucosamine N-acyltransferase